jgi:hypothetical protein
VSVPRTQTFYVAVTLCAALLAPAAARAQCSASDQALPNPSPWNPKAPFLKIVLLLGAPDCLGGANDPGALAVNVRKALKVAPNDTSLFRPAAKAALTLIAEYLADNIQPTAPAVLRELRVQVQAANVALGTGVSPALPEDWRIDQGRFALVSLPLQPHLDSACASRDDRCSVAFETVKEVLRIANLTHRALFESEKPDMLELLAENVKRGKSWYEYFETARSQYFWELAVNSFLMGETRPLVDSVRVGFRSVPTGQWLLLHPQVAFEYANDEPAGSKTRAIALMDLIGYNRWSWRNDGTMGTAVGLSFVLAAADHVNSDDLSFGFMAHVNHSISAGLVFGGDKPTIIMSADAAKLWTKVSEAAKLKIMTGK